MNKDYTSNKYKQQNLNNKNETKKQTYKLFSFYFDFFIKILLFYLQVIEKF